MAFTITQRLLCAARHAYSIRPDGKVPVDAAAAALPGSGCVGYTAGPVGAVAGQYEQDAAFVASIAEGVVVAIRGTTAPFGDYDAKQVLIDWMMDAAALLTPPAGTPPGFPGRVHFGFYRAFMRIWQKLGPHVKAAVAAHPQKRIFVTGHSKGGAICPLAAWRLHIDYPGHEIVVAAFAPARVGDRAFATTYNAAIPNHQRFEYDDDIVPHLPAATALLKPLGLPTVVAALLSQIDPGYGEIGVLRYIKADGSVVGASTALLNSRVADLALKLATFEGRRHVIACHAIDKPTDGYVKGVIAAP